MNVVDTSVYDFKTLFWNNIALGSLLSRSVDFDTRKTTSEPFGTLTTEKISSILELTAISRSALHHLIKSEELYYNGGDLLDKTEIYNFDEEDDILLFPDSKIRGALKGYDSELVVGDSVVYTELANTFKEGGGILKYGNELYGSIFFLNEVNLFSDAGFKSISRNEVNLLADKIFSIELEKDYDFYDEDKSYIRRSFKVNQSNDIDTWTKDGLFIVDTLAIESENYEELNTYSFAAVLTLNGVLLGFFEEDYEYKYVPENEQYKSVEIELDLYEPNSYDKNLSDKVKEIFPEEFAALSKAEGTAPIFGGYENAQLGFDWLTSLVTSSDPGDQELVSFLGADSAIFGINQVYLALEDCDIVTGAGKDLIILADDINNSEGTVPRIHDFEVGQDKILIPAEVFAGFGNSPAGKLANSAFTSGVTSGNANHRVIYDIASGNLYHDSDGTGTEIQQLIATFTNKPILSAEDLLLG